MKRLLPSASTVILFALMVPVWYSIYEDNWLDRLDEPWGDTLLIVFILSAVGLCGVYGATVARKRSEVVSGWWFFLEVGLRTVLVSGLAAATASLFT